jgi:hypothetical protein
MPVHSPTPFVVVHRSSVVPVVPQATGAAQVVVDEGVACAQYAESCSWAEVQDEQLEQAN